MTAYFNEAHIQQILQALDIVEVVGMYVSLKPRGREMVGLCPFHDDKKPSLNVNAHKQIFKCFACGAGGDVIKFMMLREGLSFPEAVVLLAERAGVEMPQRRPTAGGPPEADRNELEAENRWAQQWFRRQYEDPAAGQVAREYVQRRQINEETARRFGVGWAPAGWQGLVDQARRDGRNLNHLIHLGLLLTKPEGGYYDRFRERLMFPVWDAWGRLIAFGGRTLAADAAKYLNSPESRLFVKSKALYGIHAAKDAISKSRTAVVVEGYTDCLVAHQCGVDNVVATLGTALTDEHARLLARYADRIVLVFDPDAAGQKAAERAIEIFLRQQIEVRLASLPKGMDPCDFLLQHGREAFEEVLGQAREALEYRWELMQDRLQAADTVNGRKKAIEEFLRLVAQACDEGHLDVIAEGLLLNRVAKLIDVSPRQLHERLGQFRRRRQATGRTAAAGGTMPLASDSRTNAQREILEVLLNRPELLDQVRPELAGPDEFADAIHRAVAQRLWQCRDGAGVASLGQITAGCENPDLCRIITDMAGRGEQRGNYQATLDGALERLRQHRRDTACRAISEQAGSAAETYGPEAATAMLQDMQARLAGRSKRPRPVIPNCPPGS
ncbi:MAG: DNA primase [Sedimentisphaerales bacterium]|nr:DNA primase [Sedimentisphaerales bacterium]